jgi:hypothetical protein
MLSAASRKSSGAFLFDTDYTGCTDFKIYFQFLEKLKMFQPLRGGVIPS